MKEIIITLENIRKIQRDLGRSVIKRSRVTGSNNKPTYVLLESLIIKLSNGYLLKIEKGFKWDLSSVPRPLWGLLPPDSDAELAMLIHDYLYINKIYTRKFSDKEMYKWCIVTNGTKNTMSLRNLDNLIRYLAVFLFGWIVWNKN